MNRKILIVLADWIGHIGFLISAGLAGWCLAGLWISGPAAIGLMPVMVVALAISVMMYILYTWADEQRLAQKSQLHVMQRAQAEAQADKARHTNDNYGKYRGCSEIYNYLLLYFVSFIVIYGIITLFF